MIWSETRPMRVTYGALIWLIVSLAGCGGQQTQTSTSGAVPMHIVRPARPIWCPKSVPGNSQLQRDRFDARALLGLPSNQAEAKAAQHHCRSRVVEINGHGLIVTSDYDTRRVDLTLEHSIVTAVDVG